MSKLENCDQVFGSGTDFAMGFGAYKVVTGEGETAKEITRYKYGVNFNIPGFISSLPEGPARQYALDGVHRKLSVLGAGLFNKANDYGTVQDAEVFASQFGTDQGYIDALAKRERKAGAAKLDSTEQMALKILAKVILRKSGVEPKTADKEQTKAAVAQAKEYRASGHKWWTTAMKKAEAAMGEKGFED